MTREQALDILCAFNAWRRYDGPIGEGPIMPCPKEIGEAIDIAINALSAKETVTNLPDSVLRTMRIRDLRISARAMSCLRYGNVETLYDLTRLRMGDLMKMHGLGKRTFEEVCRLMDDYHLEFAE